MKPKKRAAGYFENREYGQFTDIYTPIPCSGMKSENVAQVRNLVFGISFFSAILRHSDLFFQN